MELAHTLSSGAGEALWRFAMSDTVTRLLEVAKRPVNPREYVQLAYLGDVSLEDLDGEALEELFDACIDVEKKKKPASA